MGQEEEALTVAFEWERVEGMPESPRKAPVVLSWELEPAVKKPVSTLEARGGGGMREGHRKVPALARRLSVPPPPGRPAARDYSRAVRPEDDPFLAAYLACTKSVADDGKKKTGGAAREPKGQRRWGVLGRGLGVLSCKRYNGVMEQSMVRLAKLPELDPRDA
ncbi:hypothetical protein CFC21_069532 [Triticum aestivum]|uniref:Uncharacterized protein n=3 Tax=Triticum TaxID=4564 RepID=A0A9R0WXW5_TRITD|nr:uncharacterized protein LOC123110096 [Triticum aestivum]KAF7062994.1 hypothetical protein CFC21_069532 [Triticum aestivum]VAI26438.1 unnamed protein product [Triticum turgidum subsp. durum]